MTRKAALTVRLPGASTMPATSASTRCQTGAVKKLWKGAISEMIIGGIDTAGADEEEERWWVIATLESSCGELSFTFFKIRPRHFESALLQTKAGTVACGSTTMAR
jgi:hypothetical protein